MQGTWLKLELNETLYRKIKKKSILDQKPNPSITFPEAMMHTRSDPLYNESRAPFSDVL